MNPSIPSSLDVALSRADSLEIIPPMPDPQGKYWDQPSRHDIELDDSHALMTLKTFKALHEYSATNPTGVYPGKMWKRHDGSFDLEFLRSGGTPEWLLCWYGLSSKGPDFCDINSRKIILSDGDLPSLQKAKPWGPYKPSSATTTEKV